MFLRLFIKCFPRFTNIFFTGHPATLVSIDDPTFLEDGVFVLWAHQEISDGLAILVMHLDFIFAADVIATFTIPFGVWHHYVCVFSFLVYADVFLVFSELLFLAMLG